MGGALFSQPWRPMPKDKENLYFVKTYQCQNSDVKHLRILLHGPIGAGKSSFINSVASVLQGRVTASVASDATSGTSFTKNYETHRIIQYPGRFYSVIFNDIMGFEKSYNSGVHVDDIKLALKGHVKDNYEFKSEQPMTKNDPHYNPSPTLDDRVHVLVSVFPADSLSLMSDEVVLKMREVRRAASDMGIPQVVILTKIDKACPDTQKNIKNAYRSKLLKQRVDRCHYMLGVQVNSIFLVKNYESEMTVNDDINELILSALSQMIHFGEDFVNNLQMSTKCLSH